METQTKRLGFNVPKTQAPPPEEANKFAIETISAWLDTLTIIEMGESTKALLKTIGDWNKVTLEPQHHFDLLKRIGPVILRTCDLLNKHFTIQNVTLTNQQFSIADLIQTLYDELSQSYQILAENVNAQSTPELKVNLLPTCLFEITRCNIKSILLNYRIYCDPRKEDWETINLVHQTLLKNEMKNCENALNLYKRLLLFSASNPFAFQVHEQEHLWQISEIWALEVAITDTKLEDDSNAIVIATQTNPIPMLAIDYATLPQTYQIIDLKPLVNKLKQLLIALQGDELKQKIAHQSEAEYILSYAIIHKLVNEWEQTGKRDRTLNPAAKNGAVCFGFKSTFFYVNIERVFTPPEMKETTKEGEEETTAISLPTFGIEEIESTETSGDADLSTAAPPRSGFHHDYPFHNCTVLDEKPESYIIELPSEDPLPIIPSELVGFRFEGEELQCPKVCSIRWIKYSPEKKIHISIKKIADTAKAASIQLMKDKKGVGEYSRAIIFDDKILVYPITFRKNVQINVHEHGSNDPEQYELTEMIDATSEYKCFSWIGKEKEAVEVKEEIKVEEETSDKKEETDKFDSLWTNL